MPQRGPVVAVCAVHAWLFFFTRCSGQPVRAHSNSARDYSTGKSGWLKMALPGMGREDFVDLGERQTDLVVAIVEVRRNSNASAGAVIDENIARNQLVLHFLRMRTVDGNGAAAFSGVARRIDAPAAAKSAVDKLRGLANGLFANVIDADLANDFEAGLASVKRGNVRSAVQKTIGVFTRLERGGFEIEGALVGEPAGNFRRELGAQVGPNVRICDARAAAEPFENASNGEIDFEFAHVERNGSGGLKTIENEVSADFVRAVDDGLCVDDGGAAEQNKGNRDEKRGVVDGGEYFFERGVQTVFAFENFDASTLAALLHVEINRGWKLEIAQDDLIAA